MCRVDDNDFLTQLCRITGKLLKVLLYSFVATYGFCSLFTVGVVADILIKLEVFPEFCFWGHVALIGVLGTASYMQGHVS